MIYRSNHIIQDIENLRVRIESNNPVYNEKNINIVKTEILSKHDQSEGDSPSGLMSPKVKNLIYKPIFCYSFFLLSYLNMRKAPEVIKIHSSKASSLTNSRS